MAKQTRCRLRTRIEKDALGRFVPGHSGGPGRPAKKLEQEYLTMTYSVCSLKAWKSIIRKAVSQARAGDAPARSWLGKQLGMESLKLLVDLPSELHPQEQAKQFLGALSDSNLKKLRKILEETELTKGGEHNGNGGIETYH